MSSDKYNCGEFKPGKRPPGGGFKKVPPVLIPKGKPDWEPRILVPIDDPPTSSPPKWKCEQIGIVFCPPPLITVAPGLRNTCIKCTKAEMAREAFLLKTVPGFIPKCIHATKLLCDAVCVDVPPKCDEPFTPTGIQDPDPGDGPNLTPTGIQDPDPGDRSGFDPVNPVGPGDPGDLLPPVKPKIPKGSGGSKGVPTVDPRDPPPPPIFIPPVGTGDPGDLLPPVKPKIPKGSGGFSRPTDPFGVEDPLVVTPVDPRIDINGPIRVLTADPRVDINGPINFTPVDPRIDINGPFRVLTADPRIDINGPISILIVDPRIDGPILVNPVDPKVDGPTFVNPVDPRIDISGPTRIKPSDPFVGDPIVIGPVDPREPPEEPIPVTPLGIGDPIVVIPVDPRIDINGPFRVLTADPRIDTNGPIEITPVDPRIDINGPIRVLISGLRDKPITIVIANPKVDSPFIVNPSNPLVEPRFINPQDPRIDISGPISITPVNPINPTFSDREPVDPTNPTFSNIDPVDPIVPNFIPTPIQDPRIPPPPPVVSKENPAGILQQGSGNFVKVDSQGLPLDRGNTRKDPDPINLDFEASKYEGTPREPNDTFFSIKYNIIGSPSDDFTYLVPISKPVDIFKDKVEYFVNEVLSTNGENRKWNELSYMSLTEGAIERSLTEDMLNKFSGLKYSHGESIPKSHFIQMVRRLLLLGRIDEFDYTYFASLYKKHQSEIIEEITGTSDRSVAERAAMGTVLENSKEANLSDALFIEINRLRRSKLLNKDINATIDVEDCDGSVCETLELDDAGLVTTTVSGGPVYTDALVDLGEGEGYYFHAESCEGADKPVLISNDLSSALLIDYDTRNSALSYLGTDYSIGLEVCSTLVNSEFGADYDLATNITPKYFILDLKSLGETPSLDPLVRNITGVYRLTEDEDEIAKHARKYGYDVSEFKVDFDDPFLVYAIDSKKMDLTMKDMSFVSTNTERANYRNRIIPRTAPMGIVLNPGRGSSHNPFMGRSTIIEWSPDVKRKIELIPDLSLSEDGSTPTVLKESLLIESQNKYSLGLLEEEDPENLIYEFDPTVSRLTNTYYNNYVKTNIIPARGRSAIGDSIYTIFEGIIKKRFKYPSGKITWYDFWRRLDSKQVFGMASGEIPLTFFAWLALGGWGPKIGHVMSGSSSNTGLVLKDDNIADRIIIEDEDRESLYAAYSN